MIHANVASQSPNNSDNGKRNEEVKLKQNGIQKKKGTQTHTHTVNEWKNKEIKQRDDKTKTEHRNKIQNKKIPSEYTHDGGYIITIFLLYLGTPGVR